MALFGGGKKTGNELLALEQELAATKAERDTARAQLRRIQEQPPSAPELYLYGRLKCGARELHVLQATLRAHDPDITINSDESGWWIVTRHPIEESVRNAVVALVRNFVALES